MENKNPWYKKESYRLVIVAGFFGLLGVIIGPFITPFANYWIYKWFGIGNSDGMVTESKEKIGAGAKLLEPNNTRKEDLRDKLKIDAYVIDSSGDSFWRIIVNLTNTGTTIVVPEKAEIYCGDEKLDSEVIKKVWQTPLSQGAYQIHSEYYKLQPGDKLDDVITFNDPLHENRILNYLDIRCKKKLLVKITTTRGYIFSEAVRVKKKTS